MQVPRFSGNYLPTCNTIHDIWSHKDNKTKGFLSTDLPAQENGFVNFLIKINFILRVDDRRCNVIEWMQKINKQLYTQASILVN